MKFAVRMTTGMVLATVSIFSSMPLQAKAGNCKPGIGAARIYESWAVCTSGKGTYHAATQCDAPWYKLDYVARGLDVPVGEYSYAYCRSGDKAYKPVVFINP